jgi:hypothetical protein
MTDRPNGDADGAQLRRPRLPRRWTTRRRTRFLNHLAESCNVSAAARLAGVDRNSAYDLKDRDPTFARAWRRALERAHGELGLHLMAVSKNGSVRTETFIDGETGKTKQIKFIHSYPLTVALRLFLAHQAEVEAFRRASEADAADDDVDARLAARLDAFRARLLGEPDAVPPESDHDG